MAKNKNRKQGGSQNRAAQHAGQAHEQAQHTTEAHESPVTHIQGSSGDTGRGKKQKSFGHN
ncbi:hypothetical protein ACFYMX_06670 [Streptomyces griseofuscus]|uniref:Uncharacterized protein n=2 Tax=Streptomyces TaxID=1883 RepID=A0A7W3NM58_STRMR|nr:MULTISPECIES: hypothetical protein [Streptomyces]MYR01235.1 hypothetical protein [Streptomyces sp. SID6139]MYR23408.1 hypothetical protein [Streptomyces sp. SID6137]NDK24243.1 hypothetical protein [Streptomyces sp. TR1341]BBC96577.1 hypothetical protein SRO_5401 [Streptomyces rochei]MBA9045316.1 hypothetical protein [Streptomyces murinus]